jgi:transcription elongation factor Elf1
MKECKHEKLCVSKEAIDGAKDINTAVIRCKECGAAISVLNNDVMAALNAILQKIK